MNYDVPEVRRLTPAEEARIDKLISMMSPSELKKFKEDVAALPEEGES